MTDSALVPMTQGPTSLPSWLTVPPTRPATGPPDDPDYIQAPALNKDDTIAMAEQLRSDHSLRLACYREYGEALDGDRPGQFAEDAQEIEDGIIETMPLASFGEDFRFRCGFLAMHDPYPTLLNRDALDRDEAMAIEDLVMFDFAAEERQYFDEHHADYRWNEAQHLLRFGMLVGLDLLDPEDEETGLAMSLIDPQTVFPIWGGRSGWVEVFRMFEATNDEIVGAYGGKPGSEEYARIERKVREGATKIGSTRKKRMDFSETRPITERWNRDRLQVIIDDDKVLLERTHGYRELPFTIVIGGFDMPVGVITGTSRDPVDYRTEWGTITVSDRSVNIARQMRPYNWAQLKHHRIAEAVAGRELTYFKWGKDPHKVMEYDPSLEWKLSEEVDLTPGETTNVPIPNKLTLVYPNIDPQTYQGLKMNIQSNVGGGALTMMRQGAVPPQTSGSAMGKILSLGGAADSILLRTLQASKQARARKRLRYRLLYGGTMGKREHLGVIPVPARAGTKTPLHRVTPEMIESTGIDVKIDLHYWEPDVGLAQYLLTLRTPGVNGRPLAADADLRRKLRLTPDPDRAGDRIEDEALEALPSNLHARTIQRLEREAEEAEAIGDMDTLDMKLTQIAELEFMHEQAIASGQAAPTGAMPPGAASGGGMSTPAPPPPPQNGPQLPGNSLPELGIGVGQQGGRPTGTGGPRGGLMPVTGQGRT